jgi:hypothetical protein
MASKIAVPGFVSLLVASLTVMLPFVAYAQTKTASQSYAPSTTVSFSRPVTYSTGGAYSVAVADVNGDGRLDGVFAGSDVVGVMLGRGDGTLQPEVSYLTGGTFAVQVRVGDLNHDGKADLVVSSYGGGNNGDGSVGVLLGDGDGTFEPVVTYDPGWPYPGQLAIADVNGDGSPDIVVVNQSGPGTGDIRVLLGGGDGTFQLGGTYDSGGVDLFGVALADVNTDGRPDIVVGGWFSGTVSVLLGNGDGTFREPVVYSGGGYPLSVAVADVNGDGKPDLEVAEYTGHGEVGVLLGKGDGTFQPIVIYDSGGNFADSLAVADLNGDGNPDVVVTNCGADTIHGCTSLFTSVVSVLLGNGDGTLQPPATFNAGGNSVSSVAVGDLNGDGKPDLVTSDWIPGGINVLLNNTPFCSTPPVVTFSATPMFLWPPNGKMVPVTVSGTITDTGCTIASAAYAVTDEYGQVQPSGPVTLGTGGAYSFTVWLQASRLGSDLDGRLYTVTVRASNNAGQTASQAGTVIVLHDQGR